MKISMNVRSLLGFWKKKNSFKAEKVNSLTEKNSGIIGQYLENELPVIVKFENLFPVQNVRAKLPILTVISWKYNGSENNGMPQQSIKEKMILLETTIENSLNNKKIFKHAYSRTGNSLKELVYYSTSQVEFMRNLNLALENHDRYPIEINFYEDIEWRELEVLLKDFGVGS